MNRREAKLSLLRISQAPNISILNNLLNYAKKLSN
jgi:hypothetical protein